MKGMRQKLEEQYEGLFDKYGFERPLNMRNINRIIKHSLRDFLLDAKKPAIYCNGGHTRMLMADFMYELKNIKYIVDNYAKVGESDGFIFIRDGELEESGVDAVILSTFKFRHNIKQRLREEHSDIAVLDIYDEFEKRGILLQADYYYSNHPYQYYHSINKLQLDIRDTYNKVKLVSLYDDLLVRYIQIRDFRTALMKIQELFRITAPTERLQMLQQDLEELYKLEQEAAASVSGNNVLMLCLDGLRRQDLSEQDMPKVKKILDETAYNFTNAYSFSTSTFESLIPVYSENSDVRTRYYEKNTVDAEECRFLKMAREQKRETYIYGDMDHYIEGDWIHYSDKFQTITEKIWDFILDSCEEKNGLFYLHELYESHFTFSNPYTLSALKSEGTVMLYDYLPVKGGKLRADYKTQHKDAIRYLDDVLEPFLKRLSCRMVVYADHGNLILDKDTELSEVKNSEYTCSEGWTRIPLAIRSPETGAGMDNKLISLMELNSIVVSLLGKTNYLETADKKVSHIKLARSQLYNPNFRSLYAMTGMDKYLQAFECFVFENGYKLIVYEDGYVELYTVEDDVLVQDDVIKTQLLREIGSELTVCEIRI